MTSATWKSDAMETVVFLAVLVTICSVAFYAVALRVLGRHNRALIRRMLERLEGDDDDGET